MAPQGVIRPKKRTGRKYKRASIEGQFEEAQKGARRKLPVKLLDTPSFSNFPFHPNKALS